MMRINSLDDLKTFNSQKISPDTTKETLINDLWKVIKKESTIDKKSTANILNALEKLQQIDNKKGNTITHTFLRFIGVEKSYKKCMEKIVLRMNAKSTSKATITATLYESITQGIKLTQDLEKLDTQLQEASINTRQAVIREFLETHSEPGLFLMSLLTSSQLMWAQSKDGPVLSIFENHHAIPTHLYAKDLFYVLFCMCDQKTASRRTFTKLQKSVELMQNLGIPQYEQSIYTGEIQVLDKRPDLFEPHNDYNTKNPFFFCPKKDGKTIAFRLI